MNTTLTRLTAADLPTLMANFNRGSVGFDSLFDRLHQSAANLANIGNYPPHDIVKLTDHIYSIRVAVAGFKEDELDVTIENNRLTIKGAMTPERRNLDSGEYIHCGISRKAFEKSFQLAENVVINGAIYKDGLLDISLEVVVPEQLKPRKIEILSTKE